MNFLCHLVFPVSDFTLAYYQLTGKIIPMPAAQAKKEVSEVI
jgi:hypothetical protein